jgi:uncharacterized protein YqjF (DUF2071 family)
MRRLGVVGQWLAGIGEVALSPLAPVAPSLAQPATLNETAHRPWPLPNRPWLMAQTWEDLLFAHWRVPAADLRRVVPAELDVDTRDGSAWLGVTPFRVSAFRLRGLPHVRGLTAFPELNVRTYVTVDGRPGIYFLSLDASSLAAVASARRTYRLPYFRARMSARPAGDRMDYRSERASRDGPPARLQATYEPIGEPFQAADGSIEQFLAERYCLYTLDERRRVVRADIHHPPWPLQRAVATFDENTMATPVGLDLDAAGDPLLHFAARQDVLIWSSELVR